jgi:hypothetical protein
MSVVKSSIIVVCIGLFALASDAADAKSFREKKQPLAAIPSPLRMQLMERLKLLIEYQGQRKWDKMYDIVAPSTLKGISREEFVREQQSIAFDPDISTLVDFTPQGSILTSKTEDSGLWMLFGCAQYKRHRKMVHIKAGLSAELNNNKWFFSEVSTITQVDGPEEPCQSMTQGRKNRRGRHLKSRQQRTLTFGPKTPLR